MNMNKKTFQYILFLITFAIVLAVALYNFSYILGALETVLNVIFPVLLGFFFAFVLNLPMRRFEKLFSKSKRKFIQKIKRPLSLILSILCVFLVLTGLVVVVIPKFIEAIGVLADYIPKVFNDSVDWFKQYDYPIEQIQEFINSIELNWESIGKEAWNAVSSGFAGVFTAAVTFVAALFNGIINVAMAFIIAIYILFAKEKFKRQFKMVTRAVFAQKVYNKIIYVLQLCNRTFSKYFVGQVTDAAILGVLCLIGMLILQIPYASMISAMIGILALIPIIGLVIAVALGAFMILMVNPIQAVIFLVFYFVLQQIEGNFIYPRVVGSSVGIAPIWVLIAVMVGGGLFGLPGLVFAVPTTSVIYTLIREGTKNKLKRKNIIIK